MTSVSTLRRQVGVAWLESSDDTGTFDSQFGHTKYIVARWCILRVPMFCTANTAPKFPLTRI